MTITAVNTEGGKKYTIKVEAKRGKPFADRFGMVKIVGGNYKHLDKISIDFLEENFKIGA